MLILAGASCSAPPAFGQASPPTELGQIDPVPVAPVHVAPAHTDPAHTAPRYIDPSRDRASDDGPSRDGPGHDGSRPVVLDLPAQPLEDALRAFGAVARVQIFVDADLVSGRSASAVKGVLMPADALRTLLSGSGLAARAVDGQGFTLVVLPPGGADGRPSASRPATIPASVLRFRDFSASLQAGLRGVLCSNEATAPGSYRFLVRLWISPSGAVGRADAVTSTGDRARDALLSDALRGLRIDPPPPGLPQPVTLLIAAGNSSAGSCHSDRAEVRSAGPAREAAQ
ncbi:MAG: hypothetical protein HXX10_06135 [Rhodoplanes sp.]|uniref:STN domain-containing protein n=1 Tax=Rhodoplanes sp. TaxID=1968906 RepID=UPI001855D86D|nr:STN domain-containing protein [Rhodoplanes sp.]NVO13599.1 hypothetical protein [Rhodoplanes sp.]